MDANINRAAEGVRVIEDYLRFVVKNDKLSSQLRSLKHDIRQVAPKEAFLKWRDVESDFGLEISLQDEAKRNRPCMKDLLQCNFARVQEGLRSLEEAAKAVGKTEWSKGYEKLRFASYAIEKNVMRCVGVQEALATKIYGITYADALGSHLPAAEKMVAGGIGMIQYREKDKAKINVGEVLAIRELTRSKGSKLIINDDVELALLVDADGVHLGQSDVDWERLPHILKRLVVGISTHTIAEAKRAEASGVDYIGFGPMFETQSKPDHDVLKTISELECVTQSIQIPVVAIGGIDARRTKEMPNEITAFAMISAIREAHSIPELIKNVAGGLNE